MVILDNTLHSHDDAPCNHQEADPQGWSEDFENDVARNFEYAVWEKEDSEGNVVHCPVHLEILGHTGDFGITNVTTVQEGKDVKESQHG